MATKVQTSAATINKDGSRVYFTMQGENVVTTQRVYKWPAMVTNVALMLAAYGVLTSEALNTLYDGNDRLGPWVSWFNASRTNTARPEQRLGGTVESTTQNGIKCIKWSGTVQEHIRKWVNDPSRADTFGTAIQQLKDCGILKEVKPTTVKTAKPAQKKPTAPKEKVQEVKVQEPSADPSMAGPGTPRSANMFMGA